MQIVNHDIERAMTERTGHNHECWEMFAERTIEAAGLVGKIAGRHDDVIDGMTIWDRYETTIVIGGGECDCFTEGVYE